MKSTAVLSLIELQWLDLVIGHPDSNPGNGSHGDMPFR